MRMNVIPLRIYFVENMVELARLEAGELRLRRRWGAVEENQSRVHFHGRVRIKSWLHNEQQVFRW